MITLVRVSSLFMWHITESTEKYIIFWNIFQSMVATTAVKGYTRKVPGHPSKMQRIPAQRRKMPRR